MNLPRATVLCKNCGSRLYSCFTLSGGQPVVAPCGPTVPLFKNGQELECPYCETGVRLELTHGASLLFQDERDGHILVA